MKQIISGDVSVIWYYNIYDFSEAPITAYQVHIDFGPVIGI